MWTAIKKFQLLFVTCVLVLGFAQVASAGVLAPFQAQYSVSRGSLTLGDAKMSLKPWGKNGCRVYHSDAIPRPILRFFVGDIKDTSYFCPGEGDTLVPYHFQHIQEGDADHTYQLDFNWEKGTATYEDKTTYAVPAGVVDPFLIQMAARSWLAHADDPRSLDKRTFIVADEDEIKHYTLAVRPGGVVSTPVGTYDNTIKVVRIDDPDKKLIIWTAPQLQYLPVRVERREKGDPTISMVLTKLPQPPVQTSPGSSK